MNCRHYLYTPFGQYACCDDVCRFDGECLHNCWLVITELNVIYLAYFTFHWTWVVILHKNVLTTSKYVGWKSTIVIYGSVSNLQYLVIVFDGLLMVSNLIHFKSTFHRIDYEYVMHKLMLMLQTMNC